MLHIGCHLSSSRGFAAMGRQALELGADTFQFFTRNPRGSRARDLDPALIHAVVSHGWGMTAGDAQPEHEMEKVLFAADELTGLIGAAALMRPSKSVQDMELSSLKKKYKDKRFAAGCSRETIAQGAEMLGWELNDLLERTLQAMKAKEADIGTQCAGL